MTRKALIAAFYVLGIVAAVVAIATGLLGIWTEDGRWGWTALVAGSTAFVSVAVAGNL